MLLQPIAMQLQQLLSAAAVSECIPSHPSSLSVSQIEASQQGTGDNHAISALKFKILQEFLELNWHVLLSDVDIVTLQVQQLLLSYP